MKKINKILTNVLLGALTLSSLGLANVQAQTTDTDASITITDGEITPIFPDIAINFPGKTFSFADYFGTEAYNVAATSGSLALGMNDQRSLNGITDGWKVTAALSDFSKDGGGKSFGEGTFISLNGGVPSTESEFIKNITTPTVGSESSESIELKAGAGSAPIWFANREENKLVGVDKWTLNYDKTDISLTIPNKELVGGSHSAKITWTFSETFEDAPEPDPVD